MASFIETELADQLADSWTTMPSINRSLGTCGARPCTEPGRYVHVVAPGRFVAACSGHVCDLAAIVGGHSGCPKCHMGWID